MFRVRLLASLGRLLDKLSEEQSFAAFLGSDEELSHHCGPFLGVIHIIRLPRKETQKRATVFDNLPHASFSNHPCTQCF